MPYTTSEQEIYDHLKTSLPRFLFQKVTATEEIWGAYVKIFDAVKTQITEWSQYAQILLATGIWLDQHARDRGTSRQGSETDAALRARLRTLEDSVSLPALLAEITAILTTSGDDPNDMGIVELRLKRAFMQERTSPTGTGDSFAKVGTTVTLTDSGYTFRGYEVGRTILIAGATSGANNGSFTITAVNDNTLSWVNGSGVAEAYTGTWTIDNPTNTRKDAYMSRGYRMTISGRASGMEVIVPYPATEATADSVSEAVRKKKAGGFRHLVERRVSPP